MATDSAVDALLDLSAQQRNLLLMRPIFQLELTKNKFSDGATDGRSLFDGVDTHYLSLAALTHMMEGTAVAVGYTHEEVLAHLAEIVSKMRPDAGAPQCRRIAGIVVDALDNAPNNYLEHSFEYFHGPSRQTRSISFRLTSHEPDLEDIYRYRPTAEGYLVLMGMLDLKVEDHQILVERMLQLLIERGRFDQAYEFARRARMLSIEHRQQIRDFIQQAWRVPGSVVWARDIAPRLNESRKHIHARQEEDRRMEESVREQLFQVSDMQTREQLVRLHDVLKGASAIRAYLQVDVTSAGDKFLEAQASAFRSRRPSFVPDLESRLLPDVLSVPARDLKTGLEDVLLSFYPAIVPKAPDLSDLLALLLERREFGEHVEDDWEGGDMVPFATYADPFSEEVVQSVHDWLVQQFSMGDSWRIDELLARAEDDGFSAIEKQCVVYALYRSYPHSENLFTQVYAQAEGSFRSDVASGDNLRFDRVSGA